MKDLSNPAPETSQPREEAHGKAPSSGVKTPADWLKDLGKYRFDSGRPVARPDPVISIEGHVLATRGNVMTVAGPAKAGKSGLLSAILAGTLAAPGSSPDLLGLTVQPNTSGKAVLHIDGEQSRHDHHRSIRGALARAHLAREPDWFYSYYFRELGETSRRQLLRTLCEALSEAHGGIHLIVLDGGADFVLDVNDPRESNAVVRLFESLATEFDCPVVIVLHFNPGSEKGRGHFGSQLERKCETVLAVTKDQKTEVSTVVAKFLRNSGDIPRLEFAFDPAKGYHVFCGAKAGGKAGKAKAGEDGLYKLALKVCPDPDAIHGSADLCRAIEKVTGKGEATAKNKIAAMVGIGLLTKVAHGKYRRNGSYPKPP